MLNSTQISIINNIVNYYQPTLLGVFGSYARNQEKKESDIDLLFETSQNLNLLDIIGIEQELSEALNIKVDLITYKSVTKNLLPYITQDLILIQQ